MKILIWSQYFYPEVFPINDVALNLVESGDSITILTGKPNYPSGRIFSGYRRLGIECEVWRGMEIVRLPLLERGNGKLWRLLNYASFFLAGLLLPWWALRRRHFEVILAYGPSPLPNCLPAAVYARLTGCRSSLWVQDLWPESIRTSGIAIPKTIFSILKLQSWMLYRLFDQILVQSRGFIPNIASYAGVKTDKITYVPNAYSKRSRFEEGEDERLRQEIGGVFSVVFAGNLGKAQDMGMYVDAAERLGMHDGIHFFMIGDGSERGSLTNEIARRRLENISVVGSVERGLIDSLLEEASVLVLGLRNVDGVLETVPSKLQGYLAAGKPIVYAGEGEARRIVEEANCGICVDSGDANEFSKAIERLLKMSVEDREEMGRNGRRYFDECFSPEIQIARLRQALQGGIGSGRCKSDVSL